MIFAWSRRQHDSFLQTEPPFSESQVGLWGSSFNNAKSAQTGSFRGGYRADIRGSFARISWVGTSVRALRTPRNSGKTSILVKMSMNPRLASCFSPYRAPEAPGAEIPEKWEKITKFPSPVQPRKWGKITEKLQKMYFRSIFCNFSVIFPHFRGLDRGGESCNFFPFLGGFRPGGFRGSVRGKTTRNPRRGCPRPQLPQGVSNKPTSDKRCAECSFPIPPLVWLRILVFFFPGIPFFFRKPFMLGQAISFPFFSQAF